MNDKEINSEDQQAGAVSLTPEEMSPHDNQADIALLKPPTMNLENTGNETDKSGHVIYKHTYDIKDEQLEEPSQKLVLSVSTPPSEHEESAEPAVSKPKVKNTVVVTAGLLVSSAIGVFLYKKFLKKN